MQSIQYYQQEFIKFLEQYSTVREPVNLYNPINYILSLGGKRLRPVLTIITADIFAGNYKEAMHAALAVELFHNFSLIHDDIMDDAPLRRGKQTVHEKWNLNTGILSGDAMLINAYQLLEKYEADKFQKLTALFSKTAIEVCEGQQFDIDFETRNDVTIEEYLKMIEYKTAVLVAAAMKMGAIVADTSIENQNAIYEFGKNLGIAFQLQDDYLDAFGDPKTFGKQLGGDIIENKKTFLYLKSLELGDSETCQELKKLFNQSTSVDNDLKVDRAKKVFLYTGASKATQIEIESYTKKAFLVLETIDVTEEKKAILKEFGIKLMNRQV